MILLGLTGSIGMGKSTTAAMFAAAGVPVYDADASVHALYAPGGSAAPLIHGLSPESVKDGGVDRVVLSRHVKADPGVLVALEAIVHPLLAGERERFVAEAEAEGASVAVLDIPLLYETGGDGAVDAVVVVSADPSVQRSRVLARPGMDEAKLEALLGRQLPDAEKRRRADFVIDTGHGLEAARRQVAEVLRKVLAPGWRPPRPRR